MGDTPPKTDFDKYVKVIKDLGVPIVLIAYFVFKDWTFTEKLVVLLTKIDTVLQTVGK